MTALPFSGYLPRKLMLTLGGLVMVVALMFGALGGLASANSGLSQGFTTKATNLVPGMIMGLSADANTAEPATSGHSYQLLGLVADKPLIALNDGNHQVQIVISGAANALVSDINGTIKAGDKITASPISGVGMKATDAGQIVGTAQLDFSKLTTTQRTVTDKSGRQHTVNVAAVPLQVSVSYFAGSTANQGALASLLPPFILNTANSVAGQQVSPVRVLIGLLAMVFGFIIAGTMLQAAVRAGMISIGRNPLAKKALRRQLFDVSVTAVGVLLITTIVVYIVLKI